MMGDGASSPERTLILAIGSGRTKIQYQDLKANIIAFTASASHQRHSGELAERDGAQCPSASAGIN
jgi:hypothetical protein